MPHRLTDRAPLARFFAADPGLHLYGLADLDDAFWDRSRWWADDPHEPTAVVGDVGIDGEGTRAIYALAPPHHAPTGALLARLGPELPHTGFVLAGCGLLDALAATHRLDHAHTNLRMVLTAPEAVPTTPDPAVIQLGADDLAELVAFREASRDPGVFFTPALLELGPYVGARVDGDLVAVAGVHVCSRRARVAGIGNVLTDPAHRGRGWCRRVTGELCRLLRSDIDLIGLNVRDDNVAARRCYEALGFGVHTTFDEANLVGGIDQPR